MQAENNVVLLVVNYVVKSLWFCKYFRHKKIHIKTFVRFSESSLGKLNPKVQ